MYYSHLRFNPSDAMLEKKLIDDAERDGFDDEDKDEDEFEEETWDNKIFGLFW